MIVYADQAVAERPSVADADKHGRSVLWRAATIMDAFRGSERVLSLKELSQRAGLPKSTAHRFVEQLLELGWLERDVAGYRVGVRLFELGGLAARRNRVRDTAVPHLQELSSRTRLAVNFGILDNLQVLYLERIPVRGLQLPIRDGARMPAYCTGLGKAMLAFAPEDEVEFLIDAGLPARTRNTIVDPRILRKELATIRGDGVAYDREESYDNIMCVAAAIRGSGRAIGAVSVVGSPESVKVQMARTAVRRAAAAIWNDLYGPASF